MFLPVLALLCLLAVLPFSHLISLPYRLYRQRLAGAAAPAGDRATLRTVPYNIVRLCNGLHSEGSRRC